MEEILIRLKEKGGKKHEAAESGGAQLRKRIIDTVRRMKRSGVSS